MHIRDHSVKPEYRQAVLKVLHYISQNLSGDVSLERLANIANYSPFHFQRIFSAAISESPKQYIMRLRLERAAHHLKVFGTLPVVEIATGCGFSSASIFSRAFKNFYKVTAEEFRAMSSDDLSSILKPVQKNDKLFKSGNTDFWTDQITNPMDRLANLQISPPPTIKPSRSFKIACIQTTLSYPENISFAFKSLVKWAIPREIATPESKYFGVWLDVPFYTSPDKCRYIAGIELKNDVKTIKGIDILTIPEMKYASFFIKGNLESVLNHLLALNHKYIGEMGYEISDIICYELFDECPAYKSYDEISRNILVPVRTRR